MLYGKIADEEYWVDGKCELEEFFELYGLKLDDDKNNACTRKKEGIISADDSKIKVVTVVADEEIVIAREAAKFLSK